MSLELQQVLDGINTLKTAQAEQFKGLDDKLTIQGNEVQTLSEKMKASDDAIVDLTTRLTEIEKKKTPRKVVLSGLELEKESFSFVRAINEQATGTMLVLRMKFLKKQKRKHSQWEQEQKVVILFQQITLLN
jgi:hypothetical protein